MTRNDDDHKIAEMVKGLQERIANLEEKDRTTATPNLLRTQRDTVTAGDSATTTAGVTVTQIKTARWDETPGWDMAGWG